METKNLSYERFFDNYLLIYFEKDHIYASVKKEHPDIFCNLGTTEHEFQCKMHSP